MKSKQKTLREAQGFSILKSLQAGVFTKEMAFLSWTFFPSLFCFYGSKNIFFSLLPHTCTA